jgi:RNase P/RNase MRP subunit p29
MEEKRHRPYTFYTKGEAINKMNLEDNILRYELIGRNAQIEYGSVNNQKKINGKIIFETKNTISLSDNRKSYIIPKKSIDRLRLIFQDEICFMNGSQLIGRPTDRLLR